MKLKTFVAVALLAGGAFTIAGCAHPGHERSAGNIIDDATITARVKSALLAEKDVKSFDIKVVTFNGTVQLAGFVDSQWQIDKAVAVASAVGGVGHVTNHLIHKTSKNP